MVRSLWIHRPDPGGGGGQQKRQLSLSQGRQLALTDTGTSLQRTAMHNVDTSTKNPFLQDVSQFGQPAHSGPLMMSRQPSVCTCISRVFPAFLAVCERRGVV